MPTALICGILLIILVLGVRSYVKKLHSGCCGGGGEVVKRIRVADRNPAHYSYHYILRIDGMTCENCARRVENAFNVAEGIWARVKLPESASIFSKSPLQEAKIRQAVTSAGYTVLEIEQD